MHLYDIAALHANGSIDHNTQKNCTQRVAELRDEILRQPECSLNAAILVIALFVYCIAASYHVKAVFMRIHFT